MIRQLAPQDAQFLFLETSANLGNVTAVLTFDGEELRDTEQAILEKMTEHIESRLDASPVLSQRLKRVPFNGDYPYWVTDSAFDLEAHVSSQVLLPPGDWVSFCAAVSRFHSRSIDMRRPLWEVLLLVGMNGVPGLGSSSFAVALKVHHAAVDGAAILDLLSLLFDEGQCSDGDPRIANPIAHAKVVAPSRAMLLGRAIKSQLAFGLRLGSKLAQNRQTLRAAITESISREKKPVVPVTRFQKGTFANKIFDAFSVELEGLKRLRGLVEGATVNDVVLAICSSGLRRYLTYHSELPKDSLVAWVPINARSGKETTSHGNDLGAMTACIYTDAKCDLARLKEIVKATSSGKDGRAGGAAKLVTLVTSVMPSSAQLATTKLILWSGLASRLCNLFVSNVPGPVRPLKLFGAESTALYGLAPLGDGMGLFIATPSHNGALAFNVITTPEVVPDLSFFLECLRDAHRDYMGLESCM